MSWSDRIKKAFQTFKRMALPLYAWYLILSILGVVLVLLSLLPMIISFVQAGMFSSEFSGLPGVPGLPAIPGVPSSPGVPTPPFSGAYPNPNPPTPPGSTFTPGPQAFMNGIAPFLSFAPTLILSFLAVIVLSWLLASVFMTGLFHLTKKAYTGHAKFKDFRFKGCSRVLGLYGLLTLLGVLLVGLGVIIAVALRDITYAVPVFAVIFALLLCAVAIFLAPWLSTSAFYMLNHREFSFSISFRESWNFYRRHLGSFWGYFLTAIGIQIIVSFIDRSAPDIGLIVALLVSPFTAILPIIWVLTHEEEENPQPSTTAYEQLTPDNTMAIAPLGVSTQEPRTHEVDPREHTEDYSQEHSKEPSYEPYQEPSSPKPNPEPSQVSSPLYTPHITPQEDSQINYCPTCGKSVRPGASYCSQCGTKL